MPHAHIVLLGERRESVPAHPAIETALSMARARQAPDLTWAWMRTDEIGPDVPAALTRAQGLWCVPASPYASMDGALAAIGHARETNLPFMGTCGGFQHAVLEYARAVRGIGEADHAETNPDAAAPVISLLACSLVEQTDEILLTPGTHLARAYGSPRIAERYRCRYGLNPRFESLVCDGDLHVSARDPGGEVRAVELRSHPFFVATLFQHERRATHGEFPPLVGAFVAAAIARALA